MFELKKVAYFWYAKTAAFGIGGRFQAKIWHFWFPIQNLGSELLVFLETKLYLWLNMWEVNKKNVFFGLTTAYPCSVTHPCPNVFQKNDDDDEADNDDVLLIMMMMMCC